MKKIKVLFLLAVLLFVIILPSCKEEIKYSSEDIITKSDEFVFIEDDMMRRGSPENLEDYESGLKIMHTEYSEIPSAFVKLTIKEYGNAQFPVYYPVASGYEDVSWAKPITCYYLQYTGVIDEIIYKVNDNFPDTTGEEIIILRNLSMTNEGKIINIHYMYDFIYPFMKDKEYYALVDIIERDGKKLYCAFLDAYMIEDYKEIPEYKNFEKYIEKYNYNLIREELLEKYEGMKFD